MLQCINFHQGHIHNLNSLPRFLTENYNKKESESDSVLPSTPQPSIKAKKMNAYSRINKYTVQVSDKKRDPQTKDCVRYIINAVEELVCNRQSNSSEYQATENREPSLSSIEPNSTASSFNTGCTNTESNSSVQSEDGSPERKPLDTHPLGSGICLKDPMLGAFPDAWKKPFAFSPTLPKTPVRPLQKTDSSILSPSLFVSPSQGLSRSLFPEGRGALQTLFEDVWVTPESTVLKSPSLPDSFANDSETFVNVGSVRFLCLKKEEKNKDETSKQFVPQKKASRVWPQQRTPRRRRVTTQSNTKKKCVNGFLMFCRINRKSYIRSHPGIPSTIVTKELANLWHILPKRERRLYSLKACSFSRKQNRNVRAEVHDAEKRAEHSAPSPLHMLLAYRDIFKTVRQRFSMH